MTPADRDAAVALARRVRDEHGQTQGYDQQHLRLAAAVLALAERPTCATCAYWSPARSRGVDVGYCDHADSPAHNCEVPKTWYCADHEPTPRVTCSICRRDDCGGDHPCE